MEWWQTLVSTALLGTDRQPPDVVTVPERPTEDKPLVTSIQNLQWDKPAQALLAAAGAVTVHHQVGQRPQSKPWETLKPCPTDDLPCCTAQIGRYVQRCQGEYAEVLPELLTLIAQQQQRVPETLLPELLEMGARSTALRPFILEVLGGRGQWLAAQNRVWEYGAGIALKGADFCSDAVQDLWNHGNRQERVSLLRQWRVTDACEARDALVQTWAGALAKDREAFLQALTPQLSMADEPFLETVLDDRAKGVRQCAIALLHQLPESRLCQRMAQRIKPYLQIHDYPQTGVTIEVELPDNHKSEWERDGIVQLQSNPHQSQKRRRNQAKKRGKRAGWLCQLLAGTPLNTWMHLETNNAERKSDIKTLALIMQAIKGHQWQDVLITGLAIATQRQQNTLWANAFVKHFGLQQLNAMDPQLYPNLRVLLGFQQQEELLRQCCPSLAEDSFLLWLQQVAHRPILNVDMVSASALGSASGPIQRSWSLDFSHLIWSKTMELAQSKDKQTIQLRHMRFYELFSVIEDMALTLHPAITPDVAIALEHFANDFPGHQWERSLANFYRCLNFRHAIYQALGHIEA
ncbi:MAG: DUF5691 domain-containing protein [Cyanobacteria bacterium P01_F01_bin.150]